MPAIPGWHGDPERHSLAVLSLPVSIALLVLYVVVTWWQLQAPCAAARGAGELRRRVVARGPRSPSSASRRSLTAVIAEILVGSIETFAEKAHLSDFFVAAVIVAIVGNAAEHGGAVVVAYREKINLAAEIALSSGAQVAVFLIPAVTILSWAIEPLALSFRMVELAALGASVLAVGAVLRDRRSSNWNGAVLILLYGVVAGAFFIAGDRG